MRENIASEEKKVGIEVTNRELIAVCLDGQGTVIDRMQAPLDVSSDTAPQLVEFINDTRRRFYDFQKMGIAVPGLFNRKTSRIDYSTLIPEHAKIDLLHELEKITKLNIHVENDANAAAFGEHIAGAGRGSANMFYATIGTGIGGALILNDKLWYGANGYAGEFGYVAVNSEGMKLEEVASSSNIIRRTRNWFYQDSTSSLDNADDMTIADIVREANNDDDFSQLMLQRTGIYVGTAVAGVINLLNVEKIVIGGEIMQAGDLVLNAIIQRAKELSFQPSFKSTEIVAGNLGKDAAAIGVAILSERILE